MQVSRDSPPAAAHGKHCQSTNGKETHYEISPPDKSSREEYEHSQDNRNASRRIDGLDHHRDSCWSLVIDYAEKRSAGNDNEIYHHGWG